MFQCSAFIVRHGLDSVAIVGKLGPGLQHSHGQFVHVPADIARMCMVQVVVSGVLVFVKLQPEVTQGLRGIIVISQVLFARQARVFQDPVTLLFCSRNAVANMQGRASRRQCGSRWGLAVPFRVAQRQSRGWSAWVLPGFPWVFPGKYPGGAEAHQE